LGESVPLSKACVIRRKRERKGYFSDKTSNKQEAKRFAERRRRKGHVQREKGKGSILSKSDQPQELLVQSENVGNTIWRPRPGRGSSLVKLGDTKRKEGYVKKYNRRPKNKKIFGREDKNRLFFRKTKKGGEEFQMPSKL